MWYRTQNGWRGNVGSCVIVLCRRQSGWYYWYEGVYNGQKWQSTDEGPYKDVLGAGRAALEEARWYDINQRLVEDLLAGLKLVYNASV